MLTGIDFGIRQPPDSARIRAEWGAVRVCEADPGGSRWKNPDAAEQWAFLAGVNACRIAYADVHVAVAPEETIELLLDALKAIGGLAPGDGIALSLFDDDDLQPPAVCTRARQLARTVRAALNRTPLIQTTSDFASAGNCAGLARFPLWLANAGKTASAPPPWAHSSILQRRGERTAAAAWPDMATMRAALGTADQPATAPASATFTVRSLRTCPACHRKRDTASFTIGARDAGICSGCRRRLWDDPDDAAELDGPAATARILP